MCTACRSGGGRVGWHVGGEVLVGRCVATAGGHNDCGWAQPTVDLEGGVLVGMWVARWWLACVWRLWVGTTTVYGHVWTFSGTRLDTAMLTELVAARA